MDAHDPRPVYLLAPGPLAEALAGAFPGARAVPDPDTLRPLDAREPGLLVVERDALTGDAILALVGEAAEAGDGWMLAVAGQGGNGLEVRPISLGWPTPPGELERWAGSGGREGAVLELRTLLARVARARHDINNPLTSGMAETQLLLMDAPPEGEAREGLETIQNQLRRIRDMVADLRGLRPPD